MFRILLLFLFAINIFAKDLKDLMEVYRTEGINAVEQELQKNLKEISFWKNYLENKNVDYGYYEYNKYVIVAEKNQKEMKLFEYKNGDYQEVSKDNIIIGEISGDKLIEGDKKTPEGVYDLVQKRTGLDQFYGPLALVTSYPNSYDRSLNKKGHGIWIHGMPLNGDREKFTQGCLALDNDKLEKLDKNLDLKRTTLLTSNDEFKKANKDDIALILSSIYKWMDAWKYSDINSYLNFYAKDFKRPDGSGFHIFASQKRQIFARNENKKINLFNIDISPYPNSKNRSIYRAIMDEEYESPSVRFYGKKELVLEVKNNKIEILTED